MYIKSGVLEEAQLIFEKIGVRDEHAWTVLVEAYEKQGCFEQLSRCLKLMELDGVCPSSSTLIFMSRAHNSPRSKDWGYGVHASVIKKGYENDLWIASALVILYGNILSVAEAEQLVYKCLRRNVVLWTALMTVFVEHGQFEKALGCLETMHLDDVSPNSVTLVCSLKAAGALGAISSGLAIHVEMTRKGWETDCSVGNALVDMYAKCGYLLEAQEHFERLPLKSAISWTSLITGFACQGDSNSVFQVLERSSNEGVRLDGVAYLSVLVVCSHTGLIQEGLIVFYAISSEDNGVLAFEHFSCMVDLVGRAGQLENGVLILEEMPFQPNLVAWTTMLGVSCRWQDVLLGRQAFKSLMGLEESKASAFLLMLGIYAKADIELH
ncbi:hypothetical protein L7F22_037108 [Adiantum nelumboides]|nr:hypothetical protein [Adiantum nelumboides]